VKGFRGRPIGDLVLRGKTEPLRVFDPLRTEPYDDPATKSYLDAFAKLEARDPDATAAFAAHLGRLPKDQLASFHLKRLLNGATGTVSQGRSNGPIYPSNPGISCEKRETLCSEL
jgi:adenylate cyclase